MDYGAEQAYAFTAFDLIACLAETVDGKAASEVQQLTNKIYKSDRFRALFSQPTIDIGMLLLFQRKRLIHILEKLRSMSWNGIPEEVREVSWKILLGYLPASADRRQQTLAKKRADYKEYVDQAYAKGQAGLDYAIWHQIHIDVPRTLPGVPWFQNERIQASLERLLYIWAIRHPASGYVQGINDLATPFYTVFLDTATPTDLIKVDLNSLPEDVLNNVEADTFWCMSKLLDGIQDNYTNAQPGIHRQLNKMKEIIGRIDGMFL
jgi:TBC1 domain family member 2